MLTPVEWRNGEPISDDDTFDIALDVPADKFGDQPRSALPVAQYNSTLVVRGNLPGVYGYTVNNRATPIMITSSVNIEGIYYPYSVIGIGTSFIYFFFFEGGRGARAHAVCA